MPVANSDWCPLSADYSGYETTWLAGQRQASFVELVPARSISELRT